MSVHVSASSIVAQKKDLPHTAVDGDLVIISFASNNYIGLDAIGRRIWEAIATPQRVETLCQTLAQSFQGPVAQISDDVVAFLDQLAAEGLIDVTPG